MTEAQYREIDIDSYSSIKEFVEDRRKYYKKFVLKEVIKQDTESTTLGSLVDCLKFTPHEFDERYSLAVSQAPTGQYGKFVDELMKVTLLNLNENGEVIQDLEVMMLEAYNNVKFDRDGTVVDFKRDSFETVKRKFVGSELEVRYRQLRESHGKTIVEYSDLEIAQALVKELDNNFVTKDIMTLSEDITMEDGRKRFTIENQFAIIGGMKLNGTFSNSSNKDVPYFKLKCLVDRLIIDHLRKTIHIYDLKTCWDNEEEFINNYLKYKYYFQDAIYYYLVVEWKNRHEELKDYRVIFPEFVALEKNNYKNPLIYTTDLENFKQGMLGFTYKGKYYVGVIKAINDLMWHKENGIWNISKDNYLARGRIKLKPFDN